MSGFLINHLRNKNYPNYTLILPTFKVIQIIPWLFQNRTMAAFPFSIHIIHTSIDRNSSVMQRAD